jgi:DNA transposition AAA+ family ATPase
MEEKIAEMVISAEVKAKLMKDFRQWRRIELMTVIFSLIGLILVIVDYEVDLFYNGFAGIVNLHDSHKNS